MKTMKTRRRAGIGLCWMAVVCLALVSLPGQSPVPTSILYQGRVSVNGVAFTGMGSFKFALINGANESAWSNDGTSVSGSEPTAAVEGIAIQGGQYSVALGDTSLSGMSLPLSSTVFASQTGLKLRVWFNDGPNGFQQLAPDVALGAVPYAMVTSLAEGVKDRGVTRTMLDPSLLVGVVPVGGVIAWWGTSTGLPEGFELCNGGAPVTPGALVATKPDLQARFIRGAESGRTDVAAGNFVGGADTIAARTTGGTALTIAQMPSHAHTYTEPNGGQGHRHAFSYNGAVASTNGDNANPDLCDDLRQSETTGFSTTGITINPEGGGQAHSHSIAAHDNRPAYLELFYIIRVK